jgi:hypothetical protein
MKYTFRANYQTDLRPLNFYFLPSIVLWSECKSRARDRALTFSWLWYDFTIDLDRT